METYNNFTAMPQPKLARVATALMEEVVALKGLVGKESPVAKAYAELDAAHQAERDMLRMAIRPLNVWKFCLESTEYSALKSMGGKRSDCAAVMCGVASLLGDIGVCMPPTAMGRAGALMYKVPDPVLFIDLCGEEFMDDEAEVVANSEITADEEPPQVEETGAAVAAEAIPEQPAPSMTTDMVKHTQIVNVASTSVLEQEQECVVQSTNSIAGTIEEKETSGDEWMVLGDAGGGSINGQNYTPTECYAKMIEVDPPLGWSRLGVRGGGCINGKDYTAVECFIERLKIEPNKHSNWVRLGQSGGGFFNGEDYTAAQCYARAIELGSPDTNLDNWIMLGKKGGGTVNGENYAPAQCYSKAIETLPSEKKFTNHWLFSDSLHDAWSRLAEAGGGRVNGDNYTKIQCLTKALQIKPKCGDTWNMLGVGTHTAGSVAVTVDGQSYTAAQCFSEALMINDRDGNAWLNLGTAGGGCVGGTEYTAVQCVDKCLEIDSLRPAAWSLLASLGGGCVLGRTYTERECRSKFTQTTLFSALKS